MTTRFSARSMALCGNPNVGKSTIFNKLTGLKQHTGNWPGKTVEVARGRWKDIEIIDLPGTYSLCAHSPEEAVARDAIVNGQPGCVCVVCDAACLARALALALRVMALTGNVILCVNLIDEAVKRGITVDTAALQKELGIPVIGAAARAGKGIDDLTAAAQAMLNAPPRCPTPLPPPSDGEDDPTAAIMRRAKQLEELCARARTRCSDARDRKLDRVLTGRFTAFPFMLLLLAVVLYITVIGANSVSAVLSGALHHVESAANNFLLQVGAPDLVRLPLVDGVLRVLCWVISVMLPPMAIFFPLFTLLEDMGYLPRVAYCIDRPFQCCRACGKQALTMCMGLGCNAVGVMGCRIIDSPRERLLGILTNAFIPCNGRFPLLIAMAGMFIGGLYASSILSAAALTGLILFSVLMTLLVTRVLSGTLLRGTPSSFTLEMPSYRMPQVGRIIVRSVLDRTLNVLWRAVRMAAPAGLVIWLMANIAPGGESLLSTCVRTLDPFARLLGMDGVILMAFILGMPANEIVLPLILMAYTSAGRLEEAGSLSDIHTLLTANGWTWRTAVSVMLFSVMHWPCLTTLSVVRKETGSLRWTAAAFLIPTICGVVICALFTWLTGGAG